MAQAVLRALTVVTFLSETPRTLTEVTNHLEVHKSTALRLLQALEEEGFVRRQEDGRYAIGFTLISRALRALDGLEVTRAAAPHLKRLSARYGHTIHLAQLEQQDVVYVDKMDGPGALKMHSRVGQFAKLHTSGVGKAILAHLDGQQQDAMLQRVSYERYTATTITNPISLRRELDLIRERGWAEDNGEYEEFIGCVAAPIFWAKGTVLAAVSITALRSLVSPEELHSCVPTLLETAAAISADLGAPRGSYEQRKELVNAEDLWGAGRVPDPVPPQRRRRRGDAGA